MAPRFLTVADANQINGQPLPANLHRVEICDVHGVVASGLSCLSRADAIRQAKRWAAMPFDSSEIVLTDLGCCDRAEVLS